MDKSKNRFYPLRILKEIDMTTPEEARRIADAVGKAFLKVPENALRDLATQVERLEAQRKELREALLGIVEHGTDSPEHIAAENALKATE